MSVETRALLRALRDNNLAAFREGGLQILNDRINAVKEKTLADTFSSLGLKSIQESKECKDCEELEIDAEPDDKEDDDAEECEGKVLKEGGDCEDCDCKDDESEDGEDDDVVDAEDEDELAEDLLNLAAQEVLCERAWSDSDGNQPWMKEFNPSASEIAKMNEKELDDTLQAMVDKYAKPVFAQFSRILKKCATANAKVLTDMKTIKSIKNKILRGKQFGHMTDIVRGAILCSTPEDVEKVNENIRKNAHLFEIEMKEKGKNEWGYYGSNHYLIDINGVLCEIQVMTKKLWTYKELGHEIYTQNRLELAKNPDFINDPKFQKELKRSKLIFSRGNGSNVRF